MTFGRGSSRQEDIAGDILLAASIIEVQVRVLLATAVEMGKAGSYREVVRAHDRATTLERSLDILHDLAKIADST